MPSERKGNSRCGEAVLQRSGKGKGTFLCLALHHTLYQCHICFLALALSLSLPCLLFLSDTSTMHCLHSTNRHRPRCSVLTGLEYK